MSAIDTAWEHLMNCRPLKQPSLSFRVTLMLPMLVASCAAPVQQAGPPGAVPLQPAPSAAAPMPGAALAAPGSNAAALPNQAQLDQMMAPIALYPDSLLSQVLMAATYPADVADAAKWLKANPGQKGEAAVKAVANQPWDPSVQSLVAFPQVLEMMGAQPDWVQNLGDAFLASSKDVLDSAQRLRAQAQKTGSLKSSEQQKVLVEQEPQTQQTVIRIEPANPQVVYVPAYNPTVVYGAWPYPAYPPYYYPPPAYYYPGAALATGIAFGVGVAATARALGQLQLGRRQRQHQRQPLQQHQHQPAAHRPTRRTSSTTRPIGVACRTAMRAASSSSARTCPAPASVPISAATTAPVTRSAGRPSPRCSSAAWTRASIVAREAFSRPRRAPATTPCAARATPAWTGSR